MQCTDRATGGANAEVLTAWGQQVGAVAAEAAVAFIRAVHAVADAVAHQVGVHAVAAAALIQVGWTIPPAACRGHRCRWEKSELSQFQKVSVRT